MSILSFGWLLLQKGVPDMQAPGIYMRFTYIIIYLHGLLQSTVGFSDWCATLSSLASFVCNPSCNSHSCNSSRPKLKRTQVSPTFDPKLWKAWWFMMIYGDLMGFNGIWIGYWCSYWCILMSHMEAKTAFVLHLSYIWHWCRPSFDMFWCWVVQASRRSSSVVIAHSLRAL